MTKEYKIFNSLLFIVWPFAAFINNLRLYKDKYFFVFFCIFGAIYGYYWNITNDAWDINGYISIFKEAQFSDLFNLLKKHRVFESFQFLYFIFAYSLSLLTSNERILVALMAGIYNFFFCKSLLFLTRQLPVKYSIFIAVLILCFIITIAFYGFSGFRYWTSCFIFYYAAVNVFEKKYKYLTLTILTCFLHFSFTIYNVILLLFLIGKKNNKIIAVLFIISIMFAGIMSVFNFGSISFLSDTFFNDKIQIYFGGINEHAINLQKSNWMKYINSAQLIVKYITVLLLYTTIRLGNNHNKYKHESNILNFVLLFFAFTNFCSGIPSLYGRSMSLLQLFILTLLFTLMIKKTPTLYYKYVVLCNFTVSIPPFVIFMLQGSETINPVIFLPISYFLYI
jgi:hypothetical protein